MTGVQDLQAQRWFRYWLQSPVVSKPRPARGPSHYERLASLIGVAGVVLLSLTQVDGR